MRAWMLGLTISRRVEISQQQEGLEHRTPGADLVGDGQKSERHAFPRIALGLAVQRLMLAELLEQPRQRDHPTPNSACAS
jgi:hypothetical protein